MALPERMICALSALAPLGRLPQLRLHVGAALELGLAPRAILEIFLQAGLYAGFPTAETAASVAGEVFKARGIAMPEEPSGAPSLDELDRRGALLMGELHGSRGREGYAAPGNAVTGALYPTAIQYGYGELWFRPGLDRRQRMFVSVAAFTALGLESQVKKFGQSALNVGLTKGEVIEAIIQTGPYGGFPRALNALALLGEALQG
jgi:4-carboxymuconolactone decarboxylase